MADPQWLHFSNHGTKRKRAEVACTLCHSKKTRCDLQARKNEGHTSCTSCVATGQECRPRPSRREKRNDGNETGAPDLSTSPNVNVDNQNTKFSSFDRDAWQGNTGFEIKGTGDFRNELISHLQTKPVDTGGAAGQPTQLPPLNAATTLSVSPRTTTTRSRNDQESVVSNAWSANWRAASSGQSGQTLVDPGFLHVYGPENINDARSQMVSSRKEPKTLDASQPDLRQSYVETYFEYCYTWCPILDRSTLNQELDDSPLLETALGVVGSNVRPPMIPHPAPASYYNRARQCFYEDEEEDLIASLKAVSLFYWWAPRPPSVVHRHSSWWWTAVVIRHAQQAGFHRESDTETSRSDIDLRARRIIWWTAFARERLTAICQGKPCMIDPDDCNVPEPTLEDFPEAEDKSKSEVFIHWVRLCAIIGRIAKALSRCANNSQTSCPSRADLSKELVEWAQALPPHLQLPIGASHTPNFNRDVHQLHLPYLAMIVVLHLTRSSQTLPQVLPPAKMAATCIARILKDILMRSGMRHLMPITCWYTGMAFIALLQASKSDHLKEGANADIEILILAIRQLKIMWGTAALFDHGFERLQANGKSASAGGVLNGQPGVNVSTHVATSEEGGLPNEDGGNNWMDHFPFVTSQTSLVAEKLLAQQNTDAFPWDTLLESSMLHYQDFIDEFDNWGGSTAFML